MQFHALHCRRTMVRQGLLAGEKLMGHRLGNAGLHYDVTEQRQSVRNCIMIKCELSTSLTMLIKDPLSKVMNVLHQLLKNNLTQAYKRRKQHQV
ncbi:hypothetical protein P5673_023693 [Acropora cervicornis]|uniref:Uncharacterized protein n=1 Tax=Acropora cervicornis TaxID=6130 RepID=A0AAD9UYJ3_ACRCE|nr:hypothetical protein P5673_023693 [Acropora cervicornis]